MKQHDITYAAARDRHGIVRHRDLDATDQPWAGERREDKRERRQRREMKAFHLPT